MAMRGRHVVAGGEEGDEAARIPLVAPTQRLARG